MYGSPGRKAVKALLPGLIREFGADLVVANAENIAHGFGVTADTAGALFEAGRGCAHDGQPFL